jgi:hypothetical protein
MPIIEALLEETQDGGKGGNEKLSMPSENLADLSDAWRCFHSGSNLVFSSLIILILMVS